MLEELLKEKEKLVAENYEVKPNTTNDLYIDTALSYIVVQSLLDSMLLKDYTTFDSLIKKYKDKVDPLLHLNFYNLVEGDGAQLIDDNNYSASCSVFEFALDSNDPHFLKTIIPLVDISKINKSSFAYTVLNDNNKDVFLKMVSYLPNEKSIQDLIVALIKYKLEHTYYIKDETKPNPFIQWLVDFDFTPNIIKENTENILKNIKIYQANNSILFPIIEHLDKDILRSLSINEKAIDDIYTYHLNPGFNDLIKKLVNLNVISHTDDKVMLKLKNKFSDYFKRNKITVIPEELEKEWLDISIKQETAPSRLNNKLNKI